MLNTHTITLPKLLLPLNQILTQTYKNINYLQKKHRNLHTINFHQKSKLTKTPITNQLFSNTLYLIHLQISSLPPIYFLQILFYLLLKNQIHLLFLLYHYKPNTINKQITILKTITYIITILKNPKN